MLRKIAKWYLYILSGAYTLAGILAVASVAPYSIVLSITLIPVAIIGILGPYVIALPLPLLYQLYTVESLDNVLLPSFLPALLGILAIVLGLMGIRAGSHLYKGVGGIVTLCGLIVVSIVVASYNFVYMGRCYSDLLKLCIEPIFILSGAIQSLLMIVAAITLKKYTNTTLPTNTNIYGKT